MYRSWYKIIHFYKPNLSLSTDLQFHFVFFVKRYSRHDLPRPTLEQNVTIKSSEGTSAILTKLKYFSMIIKNYYHVHEEFANRRS
jgi:hypothetical protein